MHVELIDYGISSRDLIIIDEEITEVRQKVPGIDMSQMNINQIENIRNDIVGALWLNFVQYNA